MRTRWVIAAMFAVVGAVWIGQGLGLIRGSSSMTDDVRWAIAGALLIAGAVAVGWTAVKGRPRA